MRNNNETCGICGKEGKINHDLYICTLCGEIKCLDCVTFNEEKVCSDCSELINDYDEEFGMIDQIY